MGETLEQGNFYTAQRLKIGLRSFDSFTGGLRPGSLIVIQGTGDTPDRFALQLAAAAVGQGRRAIVASPLEVASMTWAATVLMNYGRTLEDMDGDLRANARDVVDDLHELEASIHLDTTGADSDYSNETRDLLRPRDSIPADLCVLLDIDVAPEAAYAVCEEFSKPVESQSDLPFRLRQVARRQMVTTVVTTGAEETLNVAGWRRAADLSIQFSETGQVGLGGDQEVDCRLHGPRGAAARLGFVISRAGVLTDKQVNETTQSAEQNHTWSRANIARRRRTRLRDHAVDIDDLPTGAPPEDGSGVRGTGRIIAAQRKINSAGHAWAVLEVQFGASSVRCLAFPTAYRLADSNASVVGTRVSILGRWSLATEPEIHLVELATSEA